MVGSSMYICVYIYYTHTHTHTHTQTLRQSHGPSSSPYAGANAASPYGGAAAGNSTPFLDASSMLESPLNANPGMDTHMDTHTHTQTHTHGEGPICGSSRSLLLLSRPLFGSPC